MELKNDAALASSRATSINKAASEITSSTSVTEDNLSTIAGNKDAKNAIALLKSVSAEVSGIISSMSKNIDSISGSFHEMDESMSRKTYGNKRIIMDGE